MTGVARETPRALTAADNHPVRRRAYAGTLLCAAVLVLTACGSAPRLPHFDHPAERERYLGKRIDDVLDTMQSASAPGLAVVVVHEGRVIYRRAKGMADQPRGVALAPEHVFDTASLAKPVTAAAIMQLHETGRLSLEDRVLAWLPSLPAEWGSMQVRHLLSHQSGLPDYLNGLPRSAVRQTDGLTNGALLARFAAGPALRFAPGSATEYSNSNYVLLALIVEQASGRPYTAYVREHILGPAGMASTHQQTEAPPAGTVAARNYAGMSAGLALQLATEGPDGLRSSADDLVRFSMNFVSGKIVSPDSMRAMTVPQSPQPAHRSGEYYGYGWFVQRGAAPMSLFAHTGQADGYRAVLRINNLRQVHSIILSNGGETTDQVTQAVLAEIQHVYDRVD